MLNGLYQPLISLSKSKYFAHLLTLAFLCVFNVLVSQQFPEKWTGHYHGKMNITNIRNNLSSIEVTLDIHTLNRDSTWSYRMCYFSSNDTVIKDYQIVKISDNRYVMDEGLIEIPMYFANGCFYDFYTIDSMYFTSVLSKASHKKLEFNLYGGKLNTSDQMITREEENTVVGYIPVFSQRATLYRRRKK